MTLTPERGLDSNLLPTLAPTTTPTVTLLMTNPGPGQGPRPVPCRWTPLVFCTGNGTGARVRMGIDVCMRGEQVYYSMTDPTQPLPDHKP